MRLVIPALLFFLCSTNSHAIKQLKVIGYNIGCYNTLNWENWQLDEICKGIMYEKADLVGMTEVALNFGGKGSVAKNWVTYITDYLTANNYPMYAYHFGTFGWEGILMLSKYPITYSTDIQIDAGSNMRTGVICVEPNPEELVSFFMTHIWVGSSTSEQVDQVTKIINLAKNFPGAKILTGDFNLLPLTEPYIALKNDGWKDSGMDFLGHDLKTVDECCHRPPGKLYQIDFMWAKDDNGYIETHVPYDNAYFFQSDHWPIVATIAIPTGTVSNLNVKVEPPTRVDLSWEMKVDITTISHFAIFRDGKNIGISDISSFSDTSAIFGQTYAYRVATVGQQNDTLEISGAVTIPVTPYGVSKVDETDTSVSASANWLSYQDPAYYMEGCYYSAIEEETISFSFNGVMASVIGQMRADAGHASIYIDDVWQEDVDCYSETSQYQSVLYKSKRLTPGEHTIKVKVKGTKNNASAASWVIVDAFEYFPWPDSVAGIPTSSECPGNLISVRNRIISIENSGDYIFSIRDINGKSTFTGSGSGSGRFEIPDHVKPGIYVLEVSLNKIVRKILKL
ncbi:MAG: hypothetical protein HQK83_07020 [Fibrobacteria bacterium]|nr:hypothetical protein [Fibrobacteria bacterium]